MNSYKAHSRLAGILLVGLLACYSTGLRAQDSVTNPEIERLEKELKELELENKIRDEKLKALPSATVTPPSNEVTTDNNWYFPSVLAFEALDSVAGSIFLKAEEGRNTAGLGKKIVLLDSGDIYSLNPLYELTLEKIGALNKQLSSLAAKSDQPEFLTNEGIKSLTGIMSIPGLVGFAAQLRSFFNVERTIKGSKLTIQSSALDALLIDKFVTEGWDVPTPGFARNSQSVIVDQVNISNDLVGEVKERQSEIESWMESLDIDLESQASRKRGVESELEWHKEAKDKARFMETRKRIDEIEDQIHTLKRKKAGANAYLSKSNAILKVQTDLVTTLTTTADSSSQSIIGQFQRLEQTAGVQLGLMAEIEYSGGEVETTKSMWSQGRVSYVGGVTVSYRLIDLEDGKVLKAGLVTRAGAESYKGRYGSTSLRAENPEVFKQPLCW